MRFSEEEEIDYLIRELEEEEEQVEWIDFMLRSGENPYSELPLQLESEINKFKG